MYMYLTEVNVLHYLRKANVVVAVNQYFVHILSPVTALLDSAEEETKVRGQTGYRTQDESGALLPALCGPAGK